MANGYRTFRQLTKEKSVDELNEFAKEVTELYANEDLLYSQTNAARDNNLTKKALRDLMDYAITLSLVSRQTCNKVLEKSINNQRRKAKESGGSSLLHHKKIMQKREDFLFSTYFSPDIYLIANDIAKNPSQSIHEFTIKYGIESDKITKRILEKSIIEGIVSDEIMEKLIERSLKGITDKRKLEKAEEYFDYLKYLRKKGTS